MDQIQQHFVISYGIPGAKPKTIYTESCSRTLDELQPDTEYNISVATVLPDGEEESAPVSKTISTSKSSALYYCTILGQCSECVSW